MDSLPQLTDFDAKYRLVEQISEGATGVLWLAEHRQLKRRTAVKFLSQEALPVMPDVKERFYAEARLLARINHPRIVKVFDFGVKDGSPFIVFEYIRGETLGERIARAGAEGLPIDEVLTMAIQMAEAFTYCHERGVLHRDIKPDNVLILPEGDVKVIDFGVSRYPGRDQLQTQEGVLLGTPDYMAPEYFTGGEITFKVDIYAFGVVLYCMIASRLPFEGNSDMEVFAKHVSEHARPLCELRPDCPPLLQGVVERCLEKDLDDRYPDFASLLGDLRELVPALEGPTPSDAPTKGEDAPALDATAPSVKPSGAVDATAVSSRRNLGLDAGSSGSPAEEPFVEASSPSLARRVGRNLARTSSRDLKWAFLSATAILLVLALFLSRFGSGPSIASLRLDWSAEKGARVSWESSAPAKSLVRLDDGLGTPRHLGPPKGDAVVKHEVCLPPLTTGRSYRFQVLGGGDGRVHTFLMGTAPELVDFRVSGRIDAPEIGWASSRPLRFEVLRNDGSSPRPLLAEDAPRRDHACSLKDLDPEATVPLLFRARLGDGGPMLRNLVLLDNARRLTGLAAEHIAPLRELNARLRSPGLYRVTQRAQLAAKLRSALDGADPKRTLSGLVPLGPRLFASTRVGLDQKLALFEEISLLAETARILDSDWPLREILGEGMRWGEQLMPSPDGAMTLLARSQGLAPFGPDPHGPGVQELVILPFRLKDPTAWTRAQLAVKTEAFPENVLLMARLNGKLDLRFYAQAPERGRWVCHGFDPRVLTEGENELRLTVQRLWGEPGNEVVELRQVELLDAVR